MPIKILEYRVSRALPSGITEFKRRNLLVSCCAYEMNFELEFAGGRNGVVRAKPLLILKSKVGKN